MASESAPSSPPITAATMWALVLAFVSFVIPVLPAIASIVIASLTRPHLDSTEHAGRMNRRLCTLAQLVSLFTLTLFGAFVAWTTTLDA